MALKKWLKVAYSVPKKGWIMTPNLLGGGGTGREIPTDIMAHATAMGHPAAKAVRQKQFG